MQSGILEGLPEHARYLTFSLKPGHGPRSGLRALAAHPDGRATVAGLGATLVAELSAVVPGLRPFVPPVGHGVELPATPAALWCWLDGASFVAVQCWRHDFTVIRAMSPPARDAAIGRRRADNEELDDAPASTHVKRTAQESFEPAAFTWRGSMPWVQGGQGGLMFVSFEASCDGFEAQLHRMSGAEDGVRDALFGMSQPVSGAFFWCPPAGPAGLDLQAFGM